MRGIELDGREVKRRCTEETASVAAVGWNFCYGDSQLPRREYHLLDLPSSHSAL